MIAGQYCWGCLQYAKLQIHLPIKDGAIWKITICKCAPYDKALLCTLYVAVHYLCAEPIQTPTPEILPFQETRYSILKRVEIEIKEDEYISS